MKLSLPNAVTTRFARQALVAQKNSPQIMFYGGIVLMGATVVSACKATLGLEDVIRAAERDMETVREMAEKDPEKYGDREVKKLNAYIYGRSAAGVVKLYLPAITMGVAAVACLTSSHNQLTRRNAGLSAALAASDRALKDYRERVRGEYGEEKERELYYGTEDEKTRVVSTDENGKTTSKSVKTAKNDEYLYAKLWGKGTSNDWNPESAYNMAFLRNQQEYCTIKLQRRGHLFLNEVYDALGLEHTTAGSVVGWKMGNGDGYVDFNIFDDEGRFLDFMTGREEQILLDFNVDGEIWRLI